MFGFGTLVARMMPRALVIHVDPIHDYFLLDPCREGGGQRSRLPWGHPCSDHGSMGFTAALHIFKRVVSGLPAAILEFLNPENIYVLFATARDAGVVSLKAAVDNTEIELKTCNFR